MHCSVTKMKNHHLFIMLSVILLNDGCANKAHTPPQNFYPNPIIGKWQSDNKRMYQWLKEYRGYSNEQIKKMESIDAYLDTTIEITTNKYTQYFSGIVAECSFAIIGIENNTLAIVTKDNMREKKEIQLISLEDENHFSIYHDHVEMREFYKRIEEKNITEPDVIVD